MEIHLDRIRARVAERHAAAKARRQALAAQGVPSLVPRPPSPRRGWLARVLPFTTRRRDT